MNETQFCTFTVAHLLCGVPALEVQEVLRERDQDGVAHVVAVQLARGGVTALAAEHYGRAGDLAESRGAYRTAEVHFVQAFELAEPGSDLFQRAGVLLARIQMVTRGFGSEAVGRTLDRLNHAGRASQEVCR